MRGFLRLDTFGVGPIFSKKILSDIGYMQLSDLSFNEVAKWQSVYWVLK